MVAAMLLAAVTLLYAGYNLLIKLSGAHVPASATTTVLATVCLQLAALSTSVLFLGFLAAQGGHVFSLAPRVYFWAVLAGLCVGVAEIGYFYLFGGIGLDRPMRAGVAIPSFSEIIASRAARKRFRSGEIRASASRTST